ncbi:hypothetical protein ACFV1L_35960 [Kitasatospora sp. NPDC059646]|uniref:hypothetical protein n=1 Tax=Kitasatospora sp. NPDC059646 TaxID=3346893 RepID=UPI0036BB05A5
MTVLAVAAAVVATTAELVAGLSARGLTVPRNLVKLATEAEAAGWNITPELGAGWVAVTLAGRVQVPGGTAEAELRCLWRSNGKGGFRWDSAALVRDGKSNRDGLQWGEVTTWVERATAVLVDLSAEATGATHQGRSAEQWRDAADKYGTVAADAYERGRDVRDRITGKLNGWLPVRELGPEADTASRAEHVAAWVDAADEKTFPLHRRLSRRSMRAHNIRSMISGHIYDAQEQGRTPDARYAAQLADRARILAESCMADAEAIEAAYLDAEAEAECTPYVDAITAEMHAAELEWRAANPAAGLREFCARVIQTIGGADVEFGKWWERRATPGMTFWQGWDAWRAERGQCSASETRASLRLSRETERAIIAVAADYAEHAKYTDNPTEQQRAAQLAELAQRGAALCAPGARPRKNEIGEVASRAWSLMCGRNGWGGGLSLDMADNLDIIADWSVDTAELRRLFLVRHGLRVREDALASVREAVKAEQARRGAVAREAYDAARAAGASEDSARAAAEDVRARVDADGDGVPADGREKFQRGDAVWVGPERGTANAPYVATVLGYTRNGCFRVQEPAHNTAVDVHGDRLSPATPQEAAADRARQKQERAEREAERERRNAVARAAAEAADRRRKEREAREDARREAARGTEAPIAAGGVWEPVHDVPASVGELWSLAAYRGWNMTRETRSNGYTSSIVVKITGTTDQGKWEFGLVWLISRGRYAAHKAAGWARWADDRKGPRGGRIDPTIGDVKAVMYTETHEGMAAPLGVLVGVDGPQQDGDDNDGDDTPGGGVEPTAGPDNGPADGSAPAAPAPVEAAPETPRESRELDRDTTDARPAAPADAPEAADPRAAEDARLRRSPYLSGGIPRVTLAQVAAEQEQRQGPRFTHRQRVTTRSGKAAEYQGVRGTDGFCWVLLDGDTYPVTARVDELTAIVEPVVEAAPEDPRESQGLDRDTVDARPVEPVPSPAAVAQEEARLRRRAAHRIAEQAGRDARREAGEAIRAQRAAERGPDPVFPGVLVEGEEVAPVNPGWAQTWWLVRDGFGFEFEISQRTRWHVMARAGVLLGTTVPAELENLGGFDTVEEALAAVREHAARRAEAEAGTRLVERVKRLAATPSTYSTAPVEDVPALPPAAAVAAPSGGDRAPAAAGVRPGPVRPSGGPCAAPAGGAPVLPEWVERLVSAAVERLVEEVLARVGQAPAGGGEPVPAAPAGRRRGVARAGGSPWAGRGSGRRRARRGRR